jgi:hypothetical protein
MSGSIDGLYDVGGPIDDPENSPRFQKIAMPAEYEDGSDPRWKLLEHTPDIARFALAQAERVALLEGEIAASRAGESTEQGREHFRAGGYVGTDRYLWGPDGDAAVELLNGHLAYDPNWVDELAAQAAENAELREELAEMAGEWEIDAWLEEEVGDHFTTPIDVAERKVLRACAAEVRAALAPKQELP